MRAFLMAGIAALVLIAGAVAQAQDRSDRGPARPDDAKAAATPDAAGEDTQRHISEEGGMKASGPSQGKGGESR